MCYPSTGIGEYLQCVRELMIDGPFLLQMPGVVFGSSLEAAVRCVHVESGSPVYMGVFNSSSPILSRTLPRPLSARALPLLYSQNELPHSSLSSCSSRLQSHPRRC